MMEFGLYAEDGNRLVQYPFRQMIRHPFHVMRALWYLFFPRKRIHEVNQ